MGTHAPGELLHVGLDLLVHSLGRRDAGTAVGEQMPTSSGGGRVLGAAGRTRDLRLRPHSAAVGVGKFGTPWERMQWEKARGWELTDWVFGGAPTFDVPPEPVDDALPPHAATTRTRIAVAMMDTRVRARVDPDQGSSRSKMPALFLTMGVVRVVVMAGTAGWPW